MNDIRDAHAHTREKHFERIILPQLTFDVMSPKDIIIAVMGTSGSGKTTFISRCIGEDVGIGHGSHSDTQDVAIHSFRRGGQIIHLIDTPGFDNVYLADVHILNNLIFWLSHAYRAEPKLLLSGIIHLQPICKADIRPSIMDLEIMKLLCGEQNFGAVWLATTMWEVASPERGLKHEQELMSTNRFWAGLIRRGSKVCRHQDSEASAFAIVDQIIAHHQSVVLSIQRQMVDDYLEVDQTDAGRYLRRRIIQRQERVQDELSYISPMLNEAIKAQETAEVEEFRIDQRECQHRLEEDTRSLAAMKLNMDKLREQKAQELAERAKQFACDKAAQDAKIRELDQQIQDLQAQRDDADKRAKVDAESRRRLEDSNLQLLIQLNQVVIADLIGTIANRKREGQQMGSERKQAEKHESIFRHTMKVSLAETLVHSALNGAAQQCTVM